MEIDKKSIILYSEESKSIVKVWIAAHVDEAFLDGLTYEDAKEMFHIEDCD